jgi:uncharacterized OB-fold protein
VDQPFRVMPRLDPDNEFFWTSGQDGRLRFLRCQSCGYFIHPPVPICPECLGRDVAPEAVSGDATLWSYTVNHQPWAPGAEEPYVIGLVEIAEQEGLRLTTNIVAAPEDVTIGMPVRVCFEDHDPVYIPLFEPTAP